jgi:hypothetical protein
VAPEFAEIDWDEPGRWLDAMDLATGRGRDD